MNFLSEHCEFSPIDKYLLERYSMVCGDEDLDVFFNSDAINYSDSLFGYSYCFISEEYPEDMVCAFTISNASIFTGHLPNARKKKVGKLVPHEKRDLIYPAILIGRLAIHTKFHHHGIGTELMDFIKAWLFSPLTKSAFRYLIVDAYNNEGVINFYQRNDFNFLFSSEEQEKGLQRNRKFYSIFKDPINVF